MANRSSLDRGETRPLKTYRGSWRRIRRITFRGNWSLQFMLFLAWLLLCLFVLVPWMVRHPPLERQNQGTSQSIRPAR
jgi:hypothetical protein